jgi:hypothetical protein
MKKWFEHLTIAEGTNRLVNWAQFPSLVALLTAPTLRTA